jgi:hypothetical protein
MQKNIGSKKVNKDTLMSKQKSIQEAIDSSLNRKR